jgi:hypothetical protein
MDVQELRNYCRAQMDVDDRDLPDNVLNVYLQEAFDRTMAFSNRWPRNETQWGLSVLDGNQSTTIPSDVNIPTIMAVTATANGYALVQIEQHLAEQNFTPMNAAATGTPAFFSIWGNQMYLWPWPQAGAAFDVTVRGFRQPTWDNAASTLPDLDPRLHVTLAYFALSLAYLKEEDEVMEGIYLARWNRDLTQQLHSILEPSHQRPLVMHGGSPYGSVPSYVINPPAV